MRLKKSREFRYVSEMGCKYTTPHFVLLAAENSFAHPRLGITVSRRVGNAVVRNRLKRRIREYFRRQQNDLAHRDHLVIARARAGQLDTRRVDHDLERLFRHAQRKTRTV